MLMVSHADNDHAGGAAAVADAFPDAVRYAGEPERMTLPMQACRAGQAWQWDGVRFRVLWPASDAPAKNNDRSCVLLVEGAHGRLLLSGDIDGVVEPRVAAMVPRDDRRPLALLVPHHGSRSSSGADFIAALHPSLALVSAGWRNRFGHPHAQVLQRYRQAGVPLWNTADFGAIELDAPADRAPDIATLWRLRARRYWRE